MHIRLDVFIPRFFPRMEVMKVCTDPQFRIDLGTVTDMNVLLLPATEPAFNRWQRVQRKQMCCIVECTVEELYSFCFFILMVKSHFLIQIKEKNQVPDPKRTFFNLSWIVSFTKNVAFCVQWPQRGQSELEGCAGRQTHRVEAWRAGFWYTKSRLAYFYS